MKKRVLVLEGRPRRGNTEIVTDWVLKGLGKKALEIKTASGRRFEHQRLSGVRRLSGL